jgi:hypothetical protein
MAIYMFYLLWEPYLWVAQVFAVVTLAILAWRAPMRKGSVLRVPGTAKLAAALAILFTLLMAPVALMVGLRTRDGMYPTRWSAPKGIACVVQLLLFFASCANLEMLRRIRAAKA